MKFHFYSYLLGAACLLFCQWISEIPFRRRHKVVMALLDRASMYQKRAKLLSAAGNEEDALKALQEVKTLLVQAEELHKRNSK